MNIRHGIRDSESGSKPISCWLRMVFCLTIGCLVGCGGKSAEDTNSTSHEALSEFLEENPEYAEPADESAAEPLSLGG